MTKILVVDDNQSARDLIIDILSYTGYEVLSAVDGLSGLQVAIQESPELIISDIAMPNLDGYGFVEALRKNPLTNTIPIILVTARTQHDEIRRGMVIGADDYLTKPIKPNDVVAAVRAQLSKQAIITEKLDTTINQLRNNVIYSLPHEMRTPLSIIMGYSELMEFTYPNYTPDDVRETFRAITTSGRRLQRVVENYLIFARLEMIANNPEEVEALTNTIITDTSITIESSAAVKASAAKRFDDLIFDLAPASIAMTEQNLDKIVSELVDNALKFSPNKSPVYIHSGRDGDYFVLIVKDNGRGMNPDQVTKMGAFMQFDRVIYEQQGLGLGYAIVCHLVNLHNGKIHVESQPDRGTVVTVYLPLAQLSAAN